MSLEELPLGKVSLWLQGLEYSTLQEETLTWQFYSWSLEIFWIQSCSQCDVLRCDFWRPAVQACERDSVYTPERSFKAISHSMHLSLPEKSTMLVLVAVIF